MPYFIQFDQPVADYLDAVEGISPEGRLAVVEGMIDELGRDADRFLALHPLSHESLHFRYDYAHPDGQTLFVFDVIVDGQHMPSGVVCVVYGEHSTQPIP
jgi:hypothetical protein